jgi:hypothetical protein
MSEHKHWHRDSSNGVFMLLGCVISGALSWAMWKSVALCILHAVLSWFYIMYFLLAWVNWGRIAELLRAAGVVK